MNVNTIGNGLSRVVKLVIDTGEARSIDEAKRILEDYKLVIHVGTDVAYSATRQAALLTAVNTGRRCFLGGVQVVGCLDVPLLVHWKNFSTVAQAVADLEGISVDSATPGIPHVLIGDVSAHTVSSEFAVRVTYNGWLGGVLPLNETQRLPEQIEFTPSGVLGGALAVSEAFQFVRGEHGLAGQRAVGLSLWQPETSANWLGAEPGPSLEWLPSRLWLIGLGHLGQAYLWTLGFLPYANPSDVLLVLQDFDTLVEANDSTSLLTNRFLIGMKKARAMARWCETRGFQTLVNERRFAANFKVSDDEPQLALCGIDNAQGRTDLDQVGFQYVIDAGLGRGVQEYLTIQLHTLPASRAARVIWGGRDTINAETQALIQQPAYQELAEQGLEDCGLVTLAQHTVGTPFVGGVASTLVIAEVLRLLHRGSLYEVMDGDLRTLDALQSHIHLLNSQSFNPGITDTQKS